MKRFTLWMTTAVVAIGGWSVCLAADAAPAKAPSQETAAAGLEEIREVAQKVVTAFNAGKPADVAGLFLPDGEWIDDAGNVHHGRESIEKILTDYFSKFPGAQIAVEIEGVHLLGPLAIEEGVRTMSTPQGSEVTISYVSVLAKTENGWQFASVKDTGRESEMTPHDALESLSWLVGEWVNEGTDGRVHITYRWSEDGNFLLGDYLIETGGEVVMKSEHRIGWDAVHGRVHSWLFDSDGGFGEGSWTQLNDTTWHIHSSAILPGGMAGSAIIHWKTDGENRFSIRGTDRLIDGIKEDDFELQVVRKAPSAAKK